MAKSPTPCIDVMRKPASVIARTIESARITRPNRSSLLAMPALVALLGLPACTGSPATLALQPDFEMTMPSGIVSVSIRESLPDMTDDEFRQIIRVGMEHAAPGAVLPGPVRAPFPQSRVVWHVISDSPHGTSRLSVNIFRGSTPFVYEQAIVDNSAPPATISGIVESLTRRLIASQTSPRPDA
jgi:hypothetical protein